MSSLEAGSENPGRPGSGSPDPDSRPPEDLSQDRLLYTLTRNAEGRPVLGGIPLERRIGRGGMGAVYYGVHPRLRIPVAVKILPHHLIEDDPKLVERFFSEARLAAALESDHLVRVLDADQEKGTTYLVMQYVQGESAGGFLKRLKEKGADGVGERDALAIVGAATRGLAVAHENGIIHRDIKPDNILIPRGDCRKAKLADLGLAKPEGGGQSVGTLSQVAMGTPGYMSPEQWEDAKTVTPRADVFSMGATLYALLSGQAPFAGTSMADILRKTADKEPEPLPDSISSGARALVARCLEKKAARRYANAGELLRDLESLGGPATKGDPEVKTLIGVETLDGAGGKKRRKSLSKPPVAEPVGKTSPKSNLAVWVIVILLSLGSLLATIVFGLGPENVVAWISGDSSHDNPPVIPPAPPVDEKEEPKPLKPKLVSLKRQPEPAPAPLPESEPLKPKLVLKRPTDPAPAPDPAPPPDAEKDPQSIYKSLTFKKEPGKETPAKAPVLVPVDRKTLKRPAPEEPAEPVPIGGVGGHFGGRFAARENLVARGGGTRATESAVLAALKWLARHQDPDGSWRGDGFQNRCTGPRCDGPGERDYDTGLTAISLLAFLGAGHSQLSKEEYPDPANPGRVFKFGEVVKKGLQWLLAHQDSEGCLGERGMKYLYSHVTAALALSEAYGMTGDQSLKAPAQKAIDFIIAAQNPGKGWRYSAKCGDNDTSVTGWAVMALKSAELSELSFPKSAYAGALNWLNEATEQNGYYQVGYNARSTGKVYVPGKNEQFDHHASMSAVAVLSRIFMLKKKSDPALTAVNLLVSDLPEWKTNKIDYYYWYYATLALFQFDGPEGPMWKRWNEPMKNALVPNQHTARDGCKNGSWDSDVDRWGAEGGRVYGTALNALTLEIYYRYGSVLSAGGK